MKKTFLLFLMVFFTLLQVNYASAKTDETHVIKVGETVKLEISSAGRSILNRSTSKYGKWDVNSLYLEVVSSSWDYAIVKGKKATALAVVQLTVTHNHDGIYGDKYYDAFHVKVVSDEPTGISIEKSSLPMTKGESYTLSANIIGGSGTYTWWSDDSSIASVYGNGSSGRVVANKKGTTYINVSTANGKYTASCKVTVEPPSVISVSMTSSLSLEVGGHYTLRPAIYPSDAETTFSWKSNDTKVATVSSGYVNAVGAGNATITVTTSNGKSAYCYVTVKPVKHTMRYTVHDGGYLQIGSKISKGEWTELIEDGESATLSLVPDEDFVIEKLIINNEDRAGQLENNIFILPKVEKDYNIEVFFKKNELIDAITEVPLASSSGRKGIYTLNGQAVTSEKLKKGLYIIDGKKVYVK